MLINWQSVLGRGCTHEKPQPKNQPVSAQPMRVNLIGHPEETRFLAFAALKETYCDDEQVLPDAMRFIASDLQSALVNGIQLRSGGTLRLAVFSVKGDWPWLIAAGNLERHFRRAPNLGMSKSTEPTIFGTIICCRLHAYQGRRVKASVRQWGSATCAWQAKHNTHLPIAVNIHAF